MDQNTVNEDSLKRVPMPAEYHACVKAHALNAHKNLGDVYGELIEAFVSARKNDRDNSLQYMVSPASSKYISIWVGDDILKKAKTLADLDGVSVNRVIYTSVTYFIGDLNT